MATLDPNQRETTNRYQFKFGRDLGIGGGRLGLVVLTVNNEPESYTTNSLDEHVSQLSWCDHILDLRSIIFSIDDED